MSQFREQLMARCQPILNAVPHCKTEEATKTSMILPLLAALGYNPFDPTEVVPEHNADFSEKYKNKVDYAICKDGAPIIAIEAKACGANITDDRGQLRSYFNACPTVKLGILTNGLRYECFADTDEPNMMDQTPFLVFDIADIAAGKAEERVVAGVADLSKERFDPANVGTEARRKLLLSNFIAALSNWQADPSGDLVRLLLKEAGFSGRMTAGIVEESRDLAIQAFATFIEKAILKRMGLTPPKEDVVVEVAPHTTPTVAPLPSDNGIITTATEMMVYDYAMRRLAYLVDSDDLFDALSKVQYQDLKTTFKVFYNRPVAGVLFTFKEGPNGELRFTFPAQEDKEISTKTLSDIDQTLLEVYRQRVAEGG